MTAMQSLIILLVFVGLNGCQSKMDEVNQKMDQIQSTLPLSIEPVPNMEPAPIFEYAAHQLRSPFLSDSLANELKHRAGKNKIAPNLSRPLQVLEHYALESLSMKGSFKNSQGQMLALIATPNQNVEPVLLGSYMGLNHGRVVQISATQIDLVELISDGNDGYIERPQRLVLLDSASESRAN